HYLGVWLPTLRLEAPFLRADLHSCDYPSRSSNGFRQVYLPLPWSSGWLVFGAVMGILCLVRRNGADTFERAAAMALFAQCLCVLSFFALAQRYAADLCPFLIFCLIVFLSSGGVALLRLRHVTIALIAFGVTVNS